MKTLAEPTVETRIRPTRIVGRIALWMLGILSVHLAAVAGDFFGTITYNGYPLRNATVCLQNWACRASDGNGLYVLSVNNYNSYQLTPEHSGLPLQSGGIVFGSVWVFAQNSGNYNFNLSSSQVVGGGPTPTLDSIPSVSGQIDTPLDVPFSGVGPGLNGDIIQSTFVTAVSDNPALVPSPLVSYTTSAATGTVQLRPNPGATGTANIAVTVTRIDGTRFTRSFVYTVNAAPSSPVPGLATAIDLNGNRQYLQLPAGTWFTNAFTVEAWVNLRSHANWGRLFDFANAAGVDNVLGALSEGTNGQPRMDIYGGTNGTSVLGEIRSTQAIPLNTWTHVAFVRDAAGTARIYLNGSSVGTGQVAAPRNVVRTRNYIGRSNWDQDSFVDGAIADLRIWNVGRTAAEVAGSRHGLLPPQTPGLVANYRFNEGFGTVPTHAPVANPVVMSGANQYRVLPNLPLANNSFSIEFWAKRNAPNNHDFVIVQGRPSDNQMLHVGFRNGNDFTFAFYNNDLNTPSFTDTDWHHWAATYDATTRRRVIYRDGVQVVTDVAPVNYQGTGPITLGGTPNLTLDFDGSISAVRFWSTARTAQEVAENRYRNLPGNIPGLSFSYSNDEQGAAPVADLAASTSNPDQGGAQTAFAMNHPAFLGTNAVVGRFLQLNRTNSQLVQIPNLGTLLSSNAITVEFWQYTDAQVDQSSVSLFPSATSRIIAHVPWSDGNIYWDFGDITGAGVGRLSYRPPVSPVGTWNHFAFVADANANFMAIYRNGVREAFKNSASRFANLTGTMDIAPGGRVADFRIWTVARTAEQIASSRFEPVAANSPNLLVNYLFNESSGTTVADSATGSGSQNGTVTAGATFSLARINALESQLGTTVPEGHPSVVYLPAADRGATVNYTAVTSPNATLTPFGGGRYLYQPNFGFSGADTLSYTVSDGTLSRSAAVPLTVSAVNSPPVVGIGTALDLNGSTQYATLANTTNLLANSSFTIEFWARRRSPGTWEPFVTQGVGTANQGLHVGFRGNQFTFAFWANDLNTPEFPDTLWHHWSCTYDATINRRIIYRDGVEVAADTTAADYQGTGTIEIGRSIALGEYADGSIADLRIWNQARTAAQVAANMHPAIPSSTSGLQVHLRFNEGDGITAADGASAGGVNNATLVNSPAWRPFDGPATSVALNGSTQYGQVLDGPAVSVTGPITLEAWVQPAASGAMTILEKFGTDAGGYGLRINASGMPEFVIADNSTSLDVTTGSTAVRTIGWTHLAAVWDGQSARIYVNGQLDVIRAVGRNPKDGASFLMIGAAGTAGQPQKFNGRLGDIRIWNVARTRGEIAWYRGGVATNAAGLVLNHRMTEGSGTVLTDFAAVDGAQNGALFGSPTWPASPEPGLATLQTVPYTEDAQTAIHLAAWDAETATASLTIGQFTSALGTITSGSGTGNYNLTPGTNANTGGFVAFQVGDGVNTTPARLYFRGFPVDDAPVLGASGVLGNQSLSEGASGSVTFPVSDGDPELLQTLVLSATSSNTNLIRNPRVSAFGGIDGDATLLYRGRPGQSGTATITVVATQTSGAAISTTNQFNIVVQPVNDPPNVGPGTSLAFTPGAFVRVPSFATVAPTEEITIEFWQKATASTTGAAFQVGPDNLGNRINAHVPFTDGKVYWDFGDINGTGPGRLSYTPPVSILGSWQHFAFVASRSNNHMKIYRNGVEEASKPGMVPFIRGDRSLNLGQFPGQLAEFRVWNVARTGAEIGASMHAALSNTTPGLVAYYRFNQRPLSLLANHATGAGTATNGVLVADTSVDELEPTWRDSTTTNSGPLADLTWQTADPDLAVLQTITVGEGSTNVLNLPAWDAESLLALTWNNVSVTTGSVSQVSGSLWRYVAPTGFSGNAVLRYSVVDGGSRTTSGSLNLRVVIAQNDAPTIGTIPNTAAEEDSAVVEIPFTVDDDQPPSALSITPVVISNASLISSATVSAGDQFRRLSIVPKPGEIGTATIRIIVMDAGQKSTQTEFEIRIEPRPAFSVFDLGVVPGKLASFGTAINDRGAVTGYMAETADLESNPVGFYFSGLENGGVVENNPAVQIGPVPLQTPFRAWAINSGYTLAGSGRLGGSTVAWTRAIEGDVASLGGLPGGGFAEVRGINDAGVVAGTSTINSQGSRRAFTYAPGAASLTDLGLGDAPFNLETTANAINASGHVVGAVHGSGGWRRAMIWTNGTPQSLLRVPVNTNSVANSINSFGQVVGSATRFVAGDSALEFSAIAQNVRMTNLLSNTNGNSLVAGNAAITVEAWIRPSSFPTVRSWPVLVGNAATGQGLFWQAVPASGGQLSFGFHGRVSTVNVGVQASVWTHFASVYNPANSSLTVYRNGTPVATNTIAGVDLQGIPLNLNFNSAGDSSFVGALDEVRIWRTSRSATEIAANYTRRLAGNESGLVAYLPFDEATGASSTASLASGAQSAALSGPPGWTVRTGLPAPAISMGDSVLEFDGVSALATGPSVPLNNRSFSVEFRARRSGPGVTRYVVGQGSSSNNVGLHIGFRDSNFFTFAFYANDLNTPAYPDTDWHHWACTFNSTNRARRIYRDGVLVAEDVATAAYGGTGPITVGQTSTTPTPSFSGAVQELRFWNSVRTPEEIAANMSGRLAGGTNGLVAHFPLDEGGGTVAANRVAGGGPLALSGAIAWAGRDNGLSRAFLFDSSLKRFSSLGTLPDAGASEALGINDFGQVVGYSRSGSERRAFFFSSGRLNNLHDLLPEIDQLDNWDLETANGINRSGAIVGTGLHRGVKRAFLAVPATVIGRPVLQPEGAVGRYPQITLLRTHRSDDTILNSFYWSESEKRLYAIRPVTALIRWFTSLTDTVEIGGQVAANTQRVVSVTVNVWPKNPIIHISGAPVDVQPAVTSASYAFQSLIYVTNSATVEPSAKVFTSPNPGYTVLYYLRNEGQSPDPLSQSPHFDVVRTVAWNDSHADSRSANWTIGSAVTDPRHTEYQSKNGYVLLEKAAYDGSGPNKAYDRGSRLGPILPVNQEKPYGNDDVNPDPLIVVWYQTNRIGVAWASLPVRYGLEWPSDESVDRIIIASQQGSGLLPESSYPSKRIYNQPDRSLPGCNPNEEHAYLPGDTLFAIRSDLNQVRNLSDPYSILKYRDPETAEWRMRVFKVVPEQDPYFFRYSGVVGREIQPPLPLSLLPLCAGSEFDPPDSEVAWKDYKGKIYARQAGPEGSHTNLVLRWFYPLQPDFYYPDETVQPGDCLAWLDRHPAGQLVAPNADAALLGQPIDVTYDIRWQAVPTLQIGQTLIRQRNGLPNVFDMANARVIFDSYFSETSPAGSVGRQLNAAQGTAATPISVPGSTNFLARFYDPISPRTLTTGVSIPTSLKRQNIAGKEYFTDLPWPLKIRLSYDPVNNWLSFSGHLDENFGVGDPLLLPNVLSSRERDRLKLHAQGDTAWSALMDRLYDLTRNPAQVDLDPANGVPDQALRLGFQRVTSTNFFAVTVERAALVPTNEVVQTALYIIYGILPRYQTNRVFVPGWVPERRPVPTTLEQAILDDAALAREYSRGVIRGVGGAPISSTYSISSSVVNEALGSGPKVLTTGLGGLPPATPRPGRALRFAGTDGVVTVGDAATFPDLRSTPFTIEFWAKANASANEQYIVAQPSGPSSFGALRIGFRDSGRFAFDLGTTPVSDSLFVTSDRYTDTNWHHWACTFDPESGIQRILRDGTAVAARTNSALRYLGYGRLELGRHLTNAFRGDLDEVRIWRTARTASEIRGQMGKRQLGSGEEPNLALLYRCDESVGPLASDATAVAGANPGVLSGAVSLVESDAPTGIPPRFITIAENNDPSLGGLPVALHVIRVEDGPFRGEIKVLPGDNVFDERVTMRHSADFGGDPDPLTFQWFYKPIGADFDPTDLPVVADPEDAMPSEMRGWTLYSGVTPPTGAGVNYVTIGEGGESGIITLSDNAFICRYRGYTVDAWASTNTWSDWVGDPTGTPEQPRAALAEGWVKRVIRGLNPFDARTRDFHSSPASTFASMLIQAGPRYEGPIAFNPSADAINRVGLIEAYATVLNRARGLSIDGVPQVDFNPANNALLLAATKIADLYVVLGNEAYADASDPSIGFGSGSRDYGSLASSIFSFQNQMDSLLEEELTLLRGRDDSAAGVGAAPVYNHLFWNFTLGEGEVAYQQNYNISDQNQDGFIDEKDARILFPQGHGDAWGHYLEAIRQHYDLLRHPYFTWIPRSELVAVAGAAVKVDFLDERKFASMAAAKARTGSEIVDLTYRLNYVDDPEGQWQGYKDTDTERAWGVTEWARRAGTGTYFDWLTANTILPSVDPNPEHTGIDKIDRQTVRELREIPALFDEIQSRLNQADAGLNPLGLAKGVVPFDIDPSLVSGAAGIAAKTHFEQVQERALKSLRNAANVWDEVNKSTEALRRNQDSVELLTANVIDQERDYKNRLIEIFGYPHAGDIGAGKTYPGGYDGPDLYHYMYVPVPDFDGVRATESTPANGYFTQMNLGIDNAGNSQSGAFGDSNQQFYFPDDFAAGLQSDTPFLINTNQRILQVVYPRTSGRYAYSPPASWGQRRAAGEIQMALSDLIQAEARLRTALAADDALFADIEDRARLLSARYDLRAEELKLRSDLANVKISFATAIVGLKALHGYLDKSSEVTGSIGDATQEALPTAVGLATDATSGARSAIKFGAIALKQTVSLGATAAKSAAEVVEKIGLPAAEGIVNSKIQKAEFKYEIRKQVDELERLLHQVAGSRMEGIRLAEAVNQSANRYLSALAKGQRLIEERVAYRVRIAARTTENRYQDMTFRIFRNDALQKYRATFDLAQRYVFLAATAYDYESNLLGTDTRGGRNFLTEIVRQRSIGQMLDGQPVVGRPGLADAFGRMGANFDVLKTQLGFNNPQTESSRFSLRNELFRLRNGSDLDWRSVLTSKRVANLWDIPEFRRYCRSFAPESAGAQPGLVIRFPTTVRAGQNFFDWPLGGGDSAYDPSRFSTRIRGVGVWFSGYNGLGLSQTPRIYLVPAGADILSSPNANDFVTRSWRVVDQALPVPFPIGANRLSDAGWIPVNDSVGGSFAEVRRFSGFRAYHDSGGFTAAEMTSDSRLIGRSVWNTDWMLIIPGQTFLNNADAGLDAFIRSVDDIKLTFQTYSYSGN